MPTSGAGKAGTPERRQIGLVDLPAETLLTVVVDGRPLASLSCSPFGRRELALGWIFSQGLIASANDLASLRLAGGRALVRLRRGGLRFDPDQVTGPSGGAMPARRYSAPPRVRRGFTFTLAQAVALMEQLPGRAARFRRHGGIHCSMLADMDRRRILASREDIGRSNSVDKVIGWGLAAGIDFGRCGLFTTGRVSAEMALKCLQAGVPLLVSQTTLTTRALAVVRRSGLALVGHVLKPRPILINY